MVRPISGGMNSYDGAIPQEAPRSKQSAKAGAAKISEDSAKVNAARAKAKVKHEAKDVEAINTGTKIAAGIGSVAATVAVVFPPAAIVAGVVAAVSGLVAIGLGMWADAENKDVAGAAAKLDDATNKAETAKTAMATLFAADDSNKAAAPAKAEPNEITPVPVDAAVPPPPPPPASTK